MTGPRSGSRLYAASWASPTASNQVPAAQTTTPTHTSQGAATSQCAAAMIGRASRQIASPCGTYTFRTAAPQPAAAQQLGVPRVLAVPLGPA